MIDLTTDINYLKGVGPKRAEILKSEIGVYTFEDLIYYFPYRYTDKSRFYQVQDIKSDSAYVQIRGKFCCFSDEGQGKKKYLHAEFFDETGSIDIVWFQRIKWVKENIDTKKEYVIFGKPNEFRGEFSMVHPEFEELEKFNNSLKTSFQAEYNTSEKMKKFFLNSRVIGKLVQVVFKGGIDLIEPMPAKIMQDLRLLPLKEALFNIHFPQTVEKVEAARNRFKFEELFINQLALIKQKKIRFNSIVGFVFEKVGDYFMNFFNNNLAFELTGAQKKVLKEIRADFKSGKQCNRLLQGDVGSGKTIVALMSMLIALDNGFQACIMAPTEILAQQHFESITEMLKGIDINVRLLTGSTKTKQRRIIDEELQSGELQILIGTHALIEDKVQFKNLGLAVVDEQHRFGVAQRAKLWTKNINPPHVIVMTATPIPRTLSMTLYGDLDVSVIDELPPGRKPIRTVHYHENHRGKVYEAIRKEIEKGRQIYIVYPLIKESETLDYKNLEEGYEAVTKFFKAPKYKVSMVHGQMKADEKQAQMDMFVKGETNILVATTVIEVGVNVPNASVMIIESSERFGLSQLHQLRGRVGRGAEQSFCVLMTGNKLTSDAKQRIRTMTATNDGFQIAEVDLRLRGPGDMFGTQQSGMALNFRIANLITDGKILQIARKKASELLEEDPKLLKPENKRLATEVQKYIKASWGLVS
ncbi:MAG: ATP-dependent DNA helicase RecG [Bacteroidales bacterium]|nr:ATP-dependent DNA helicase RecG [Bacteroidales bacterium]